MSPSCVLYSFCPPFPLYNHIPSYVYMYFTIIILKKLLCVRSIKNNRKCLVYFYLILALCSSLLYVDFSFWPILLSFSPKDFIKYVLQCRCTGNKSPQIVFDSHTSPLLLKDNFSEYRILSWWILSQHFKYFTPLSSCFHCFWSEVRSNSYLCSSICKIYVSFSSNVLGSFSLSLILCNFKMIYWGVGFLKNSSCFMFSELPGSVICCLTLIWGNSQSLLFQIMLFLSFSFSIFILCM